MAPKSKPGQRMATGIYRQADGSLSIRFSTGRRNRETGNYEIFVETFRGSVEDAKKRRSKLISEHAEGRLKPVDKHKSFGDYMEAFFRYNDQRVAMKKIRRSTADYYAVTIKPYFGKLWDKPLTKITADDILQVFAQIKTKNGRSCSTDYVLSVYRAFRAAWKSSVDLKIPVPDILNDIKKMMPDPLKKRRTVLEPYQYRKLLAATDDPITHGILTCLMHTAMRLNECLGLRWSDVDFNRMQITVEQQVLKKPDENGNRFGPHKTYAAYGPRIIKMTKTLAGELKSLRPVLAVMKLKAGQAWQNFDLCFPTSIGTPIAYSRWERNKIKPLFAKAGVPPIRVHDIRHSTVTYLLAEGVSPAIVQEIAGHSDIKTTMVYKHLIANAQSEAMDKLDKAMR